MKRRTRASDVAEAVNVSVATVSLVLNGKDAGRVLPETRQRILEATQRLGYTIDRRARGLATGRSGMIGFIAPDISNPFFGLVHMALLQALGDRYQVLVVATEIGEAAARHNIEQLLAIGVEAVVAVSVDRTFLSSHASAVPLILVDLSLSGPGIVSINYAIEKGSEELARHLLDLGHRRYVYLDGATPSRIFAAQREALARTMMAGGATAPIRTHSRVDLVEAAARTAADCHAWVEAGATALVCATDIQAYGAIAALREAGIAVPTRMSIASFDDLPTSGAVARLTAVHIPAEELGRTLARELTESLGSPERNDPRVVIEAPLHIRETTARAMSC